MMQNIIDRQSTAVALLHSCVVYTFCAMERPEMHVQWACYVGGALLWCGSWWHERFRGRFEEECQGFKLPRIRCAPPPWLDRLTSSYPTRLLPLL